jgi:hypothetical protein
MQILILPLLLIGSLAAAAETPPAPLDAATIARAEAAAEEYLKAHPYADPPTQSPERLAADHAFDQIDADLREASIYLDEKNPSKAGDLFLSASKGMNGISASTRHFADDHYRASLHQLSQLAQRLLQDQTLLAKPVTQEPHADAPAAPVSPETPAPVPAGPGPTVPGSDGTSTK